jgi:hypothetical protein
VLSTALHMADGLQILWTSWLKDGLRRPWPLSSRMRRRAAMLGAFSLPSLLGLYVLFREPLMAFPSLATRYRAVYLYSSVYQG